MKIAPHVRLLPLLLILLILSCKNQEKLVTSNESESFREVPKVAKEQQDQNADEKSKSKDYFDLHYLRNIDHIYKDNIATALLYRENDPLSLPILQYGSAVKLELHFDDLNANSTSYNYKIQHCNADWEPSDLIPQEFLEGFNNDLIEQPASSENTHYQYTHYTYLFPNENFKLTKSGNYLIHVFEGDSILLTKRFMVIESKVTIDATVKQATRVQDQGYKQELDFIISHPTYEILDPYKSLKIMIFQNSRQDNFVSGIQPNFVKNNELHYNYEDINVFEGGHEFRGLDLKSVRFNSSMIDQWVVEKDGYFHAYLFKDEPRSYKQYLHDEDINGRFIIEKDKTTDPNIESDYVFVHFNLLYDVPETNADIYLLGQLSNWQISEGFKMSYNYENKQYEKVLLLKQGYYDYLYAYLEDHKKSAELSVVEGTHAEADNDYSVYVYYRQPGDNYDRLIGVKNLNSRN